MEVRLNRRRWKVLFAFFAGCALASLLGWAILLTSICSNPRKPVAETQQVIPYNCHGMTVYMSPLEDALRHWLIPIGGVFTLLSVAAAVLAILSTAKVHLDVQIQRASALHHEDERDQH